MGQPFCSEARTVNNNNGHWHVRTKKNIERVRRDEEKAAEEEKEKQRRIALAEQEARTDLLRVRSRNKAVTDGRGNNSVTDGSEISVSEDKQQPSASQDLFPITFGGSDIAIPGLGGKIEHINFFKDIEDGVVKQGKNKEHEEEKKKEQEEFEKKIGLLTYLGQSSSGGQESAPWYLQKSKKKDKHKDGSEPQDDEDREVNLKLAMEEKRKKFLDPLMQMKEFVDKKKHKHSKKKHKDKERKGKGSDKSRSTSSSSKSSNLTSSSSSSSKKTIEQLRAERLARERQENIKTRALLSQCTGETTGIKRQEKESSSEDEIEERRGVKRKYNSQYNPEFVRQPKSRHRENFH